MKDRDDDPQKRQGGARDCLGQAHCSLSHLSCMLGVAWTEMLLNMAPELRSPPPPAKYKTPKTTQNRGPVPVPLRVGAPGKPLLRVSAAWHLVCDLALRVCVIVKVLVMVSVLSVILSCLSYSPKEWAKRRDNPSGVPVL